MDRIKYPTSEEWMERPTKGFGEGAIYNGTVIDIRFRNDPSKEIIDRRDLQTPLTEEEVLKLTWTGWMKDKPEGTQYYLGYAMGHRFLV